MKTVRKGIYFPQTTLKDMQKECERLNRPLAWLITRSWLIARAQLQQVPSEEEIICAPSQGR